MRLYVSVSLTICLRSNKVICENCYLNDFAAVCSRTARQPRAPAQLRQQLSSREQPFISLSLSPAYRRSCPHTQLLATSPHKSCRCWRAASIAGGVRWRTTSTVSQLFSSLLLHLVCLCLPHVCNLMFARPPGQHQQNPQNCGAHVLGQIYDAGQWNFY